MSVEPTVIFVHLPKTAGTTLRNIIRRQYPARQTKHLRIREQRHFDDFGSIPEEERTRIRYIYGHMPFGVHRFLRQPATYITVVRNPIQRVISFYEFMRRMPGTGLHDRINAERMTLEDFVIAGPSRPRDNYMTRFLSDRPFEPGAPTHLMLQEAKDNLARHFAVVGLTDRFDETLVLMKHTLGWTRPIYYLQLNVRRQRDRSASEKPSPDVIQLIEQRNDLDMKLYTHAAELLEGQITAAGAGFQKQLASFRNINRHLSRISPAAPLLARIKALVSPRSRLE